MEAWNQWRQDTRADRSPDLSGADFSYTDLAGANLTRVRFRGANLQGARLSCAVLAGADLTAADLAGADLSGIHASPNFAWADNGTATGQPEAVLCFADRTRLYLADSDSSNSDFAEAGELARADLQGAPLTAVHLDDVEPQLFEDSDGNDLYEAQFIEGVEGGLLEAATFAGACLAGADLTGADLVGVDLSGADLREALLAQADLRGADLSGADSRGAELSAEARYTAT